MVRSVASFVVTSKPWQLRELSEECRSRLQLCQQNIQCGKLAADLSSLACSRVVAPRAPRPAHQRGRQVSQKSFRASRWGQKCTNNVEHLFRNASRENQRAALADCTTGDIHLQPGSDSSTCQCLPGTRCNLIANQPATSVPAVDVPQ